MISYRWMIETPDDFVQKAGNEEALRHVCRNAARAQIEEFVFIDLAGRCAVCATDVIGEDFEAGHRIRFSGVAQKEITNFLISVGEMSVRFHAD